MRVIREVGVGIEETWIDDEKERRGRKKERKMEGRK